MEKRAWVISGLKVDDYDVVLNKVIVGLELNQVKYPSMRWRIIEIIKNRKVRLGVKSTLWLLKKSGVAKE